jgi:two-component system, cell cycle response regulator
MRAPGTMTSPIETLHGTTPSSRMRILIADDDPVSRRILEGTLRRLGHTVEQVADGTAAIARLLAPDGPRMAILDWMMPGTDGLHVCHEVRRRAEAYVYMILLTARDGPEDRVAALGAEVDDFLTKPLDAVELRARLRSGERVLHLQERLLETQEALRHQATHDYLTGLWNRRMILEEVAAELARANREGRPLAVAIADLDHFKQVNDTHGHATGDVVLKLTASRIRSVLRGYDAVGRMGGEEFLLLLPGCNDQEAVEIAERARAAVAAEPMAGPSGPVPISMSVGVACSPLGEPAEVAPLIEAADAALYRAKANGRNQVHLSSALQGARDA